MTTNLPAKTLEGVDFNAILRDSGYGQVSDQEFNRVLVGVRGGSDREILRLGDPGGHHRREHQRRDGGSELHGFSSLLDMSSFVTLS